MTTRKRSLTPAEWDALARPQRADALKATGVNLELFREIYLAYHAGLGCPFQAREKAMKQFFTRGEAMTITAYDYDKERRIAALRDSLMSVVDDMTADLEAAKKAHVWELQRIEARHRKRIHPIVAEIQAIRNKVVEADE